MKRLSCWFVLVCAAVILSGCASTELKSSWRSPDYQGPPLKKIAVFMLSSSENMRRFAEDQVVRSLPPSTKAVPSYALFATPEADIDNVKSKLSTEGFDSVLIARTVSDETSVVHVPARTSVVPTPVLVEGRNPDGSMLDGYYRYVWAYTYQSTQGYTAKLNKTVVETVLYRLPEGDPVWSAVSESTNAASQANKVQELVQLIEKLLAKEGFIDSKDK